MDLDDFKGFFCNEGPYPLTRELKRLLEGDGKERMPGRFLREFQEKNVIAVILIQHLLYFKLFNTDNLSRKKKILCELGHNHHQITFHAALTLVLCLNEEGVLYYHSSLLDLFHIYLLGPNYTSAKLSSDFSSA